MLTDEEREALADLSTFACCSCRSCNHYLPNYEKYANEPCSGIEAEISRIVTARVSAALREAAAEMEQTWTRTDDATYYDESVTSGHVEWLRERADQYDQRSE